MIPDVGGAFFIILAFGFFMAAPPVFIGPLGGAMLGRLYPDKGIVRGTFLGVGLGFTGALVSLVFNAQWVTVYSWNSIAGLLVFVPAPIVASIWSVAITKAILGRMRPHGDRGGVAWFFWVGVIVFAIGATGLIYALLTSGSLQRPFPVWPFLAIVMPLGGILAMYGTQGR